MYRGTAGSTIKFEIREPMGRAKQVHTGSGRWAGARSDRQLTQPSQPASIHPIRGGSAPAGADPCGAGAAHVFRGASHYFFDAAWLFTGPVKRLFFYCHVDLAAALSLLAASLQDGLCRFSPLLPTRRHLALPRDGEVVVVDAKVSAARSRGWRLAPLERRRLGRGGGSRCPAACNRRRHGGRCR